MWLTLIDREELIKVLISTTRVASSRLHVSTCSVRAHMYTSGHVEYIISITSLAIHGKPQIMECVCMFDLVNNVIKVMCYLHFTTTTSGSPKVLGT